MEVGEDPPSECTGVGEKCLVQFLGSPCSLSECTFWYERMCHAFLFLNWVLRALVAICGRV